VTARTNRLDSYQRAHNWLGLPIAVVYKLVDDQGAYLAALIAYYGFLSVFPLVLLGATVLGFVLNGNPALQHSLLSSALADFPVIGAQIQHNIHAYTGSGLALAISIVVALYGALGIAQASQNAMNIIWGVPRNTRPNLLKARLRSLVLLALLGFGVLATTALSALATGAQSLVEGVHLGPVVGLLAILASAALNASLFVIAFRALTIRKTTLRDVALGAIAASVGWEVLQILGTYYLAHKLKGSREVYGAFALVIGLMAWIYVEAFIVVLCAELNAVLRHRLWPRSLLTPFTDNVELTPADEHSYSSYAQAQRFKGFERIGVTFERGHPATPEVGHIPVARELPVGEGTGGGAGGAGDGGQLSVPSPEAGQQ
jgi:membrane protein